MAARNSFAGWALAMRTRLPARSTSQVPFASTCFTARVMLATQWLQVMSFTVNSIMLMSLRWGLDPINSTIRHAVFADRALHVALQVRLPQSRERGAVPAIQERHLAQVRHHPPVARVEAAGGQLAVEGDMALGEKGPARQRPAQRREPPLVPRDGQVGQLLLALLRQAAHRVQRQPVMLVHVRQDLGDERAHALLLLAVVADARRVDAARVIALVAHAPGGLEVVDGIAVELALDLRYLLELLLVRVVHGELERI